MKSIQAKFVKTIKSLKLYLLTFLFLLCSFVSAFVLCIIFNKPQSAWFIQLEKSLIYPPEILFPIFWIIVYLLLIFTCTFIVHKSKSTALIIYIAVTLVFHVLWNLFFFILHSPLFGFLILLALIFLGAKLLKMSFKINKVTGCLNILYIVWISYLLILNYCILMIN